METLMIKASSCLECPYFNSKRHYTGDSFEMVFEQSCGKKEKRIALVDATDKQPEIPPWCPIKV